MKTALLIIDVQEALCSGQWAAFDIDNVVDRINRLSSQARALGVPVFVIQHEEDGGPLQFDSPGWQLYQRLAVEVTDIRLRKTATDSFYRTQLHALLQQREIAQLVICGMQSEYCVDSTVRSALAHGYRVQLVADGHTTLDNEALSAAQISAHHNITLGNLGNYGPQIGVIPAAQVRFDV